MRKSLFFLFSILISLNIHAQNSIVEQAQELIESKKYEQAAKVLFDADPDNEKPDIVIEKTSLFLNYYVTSLMHQMFAVTDLEADQTIYDVRGQEGSFKMYSFQADSILKSLITKYPENYELNKCLGDFYHEIHMNYGDNWLQLDSLTVSSFLENYKLAYDHDVYDYWSTFGIGYAYLVQEKYAESIEYFEKSISLKDDYPTSYYNLIYSYLFTDQREKAIEKGKKAFELYSQPSPKSDAALLVGDIFTELEQYDQALEYYEKAFEINPNSYYIVKPYLNLALYLNNDEYKELTVHFFEIAPANPTIYNDLSSFYSSNDKELELVDFFKNQLKTHDGDEKIIGNLYFYIGRIYFTLEMTKEAVANFTSAKEHLLKIYEPDNYVFEIIDDFLEENGQ